MELGVCPSIVFRGEMHDYKEGEWSSNAFIDQAPIIK